MIDDERKICLEGVRKILIYSIFLFLITSGCIVGRNCQLAEQSKEGIVETDDCNSPVSLSQDMGLACGARDADINMLTEETQVALPKQCSNLVEANEGEPVDFRWRKDRGVCGWRDNQSKKSTKESNAQAPLAESWSQQRR